MRHLDRIKKADRDALAMQRIAVVSPAAFLAALRQQASTLRAKYEKETTDAARASGREDGGSMARSISSGGSRGASEPPADTTGTQ